MLNIEQRFRIADGAETFSRDARPPSRPVAGTLAPLPSATALVGAAMALGLLATWLSALIDI